MLNDEVGGEAEWGSGSSPASASLRRYQLHVGATRECQQQQQEQRGDACVRWKERERAREAKIHQYVKKKKISPRLLSFSKIKWAGGGFLKSRSFYHSHISLYASPFCCY